MQHEAARLEPSPVDTAGTLAFFPRSLTGSRPAAFTLRREPLRGMQRDAAVGMGDPIEVEITSIGRD